MLQSICMHLKSNQGSEYTEKMILIAVSFIIGTLLVSIIMKVLSESYGAGMGQIIENIFNI